MQEVSLKTKKPSFKIKESYKSLRTNIEFCGDEVKVIAITSCTPNEGKSSVSMGLAEAFGEAGKRTLLVDADLRKSVLVSRYRTGQIRLGLVHYLVGQNTAEEVICKTDSPNLYVVFSGPVPPNPSELMGGERFSKFIENARKMYDIIIVDTPPLGSVIDAAVVATKCDGTVMVIENNAVSYRFAQSVKEQLDRSGCRILGAVLNKVDMSSNGHYGHYGKYYGRYYGKYYGKYYGNYGDYGEHPASLDTRSETWKSHRKKVRQNKNAKASGAPEQAAEGSTKSAGGGDLEMININENDE